MTKLDERRIYVACLASYNAGRLHGRWIDVDGQDADAINAEIRAMLKASPEPNVYRADYACSDCGHTWTQDVSPYYATPTKCPECDSVNHTFSEAYPSAEEFAIHDHEGFEGLLGEYSGIDEVVYLAEALDEHGDVYAGLRKDGYNHEDALQKIEEDYCGCYASLEDWAEQHLDDTGLFHDLPDDSLLRQYFDFESYARDKDLGGDIMTVDGEDGLHVFYNR